MQLHPRHFGRDLRDKLVSKLMKDVEGTCSGRHGFIVAITGIESVGKGLIRDGTGFVTFPVKYQCVVFRPFKGEILEAVVTMVNKMGFFAEAGPVQIFVSNHEDYVAIKDESVVNLVARHLLSIHSIVTIVMEMMFSTIVSVLYMGRFRYVKSPSVIASAMLLFLAHKWRLVIGFVVQLIPDDMEFQSGDAPNYTTSDGSVKIQKDSEVRLKIIGTRVDATEICEFVNSRLRCGCSGGAAVAGISGCYCLLDCGCLRTIRGTENATPSSPLLAAISVSKLGLQAHERRVWELAVDDTRFHIAIRCIGSVEKVSFATVTGFALDPLKSSCVVLSFQRGDSSRCVTIGTM
nr:DNA-directed RNA polymerase ii subunit rpb7 [Ipomoea batatas]